MNKTDAAPLDLAALLHTAYDAQAEVESKLAKVGLSMAKLQALEALAEAGESLPLSQLADRLACVKSNITQLVDRLEADGFVVREADPGDRRAKLAALTAEGRRICKEGVHVRQAAERELITALTGDEAIQLATLLGKLRKHPR
jgi:DNA-binding MarR family transcriptional regulator